jgi:hypothetical protein
MKYLILAICLFGIFGCATTKALIRTNRVIIIDDCLADIGSMQAIFNIGLSLEAKKNIAAETKVLPSCRHYYKTVEYQLSTAKLMEMVTLNNYEVLSKEEFEKLKSDFGVEFKKNIELRELLLTTRNNLLGQVENGSWE